METTIKITKGQIRAAMLFAAGWMLATGDWSMSDLSALVTDLYNLAGIVLTAAGAGWSAVDKTE